MVVLLLSAVLRAAYLVAAYYLLLTTHYLLGRGPDQRLRGIGPGSGAGLSDQRGASAARLLLTTHYSLRTTDYALLAAYC